MLSFSIPKINSTAGRLTVVVIMLVLLCPPTSQADAPYLPSGGASCDTTGTAPYKTIAGVGHVGEGAGVAMGDINRNGLPDAVFLAYDAPGGANNFRYRVTFDINLETGINNGATAWRSIDGVGHVGQGAGLALADIDGNGRLDMVVMAYDAPGGANNFRYRVAWNLSNGGVAANVDANYTLVDGVGDEAEGAGVALADINDNGTLDMVLMAYDDPGPANRFRYRVGWDLNAAGTATSWSAIRTVSGLGHLAEGADLVIMDVDLDGNLDMVLMAYDNPHWNNFRYKVGWSLRNNGVATRWSRWFMLKGVTTDADGAGLAAAYSPQTGQALMFMAYHDPAGDNQFRYFIRRLTTSGATFGIADDGPPNVTNALRVPNTTTGQTASRLFNLNMGEVQQTAEDAYALYVFYCLFVALGGDTPTHPACWHDYPEDDTNIVSVFADPKFKMQNGPDLMAASVAFYVDAYMGWTEDAINGYVLNTIHNLNYDYGGDAIPAYYTIRYTDPTRHPNLINQLQAQNPDWANAYNDGRIFHGDCEDFAILRHSLLRALGFDRNYIWDALVPGHEFNIVLYKGAYRIMDYGQIYGYFCSPGGKKHITTIWNQPHDPRAGSIQHLYNYILGRNYPDRCDNNFGWLFTQTVFPDIENNSRCP